MKLIQPGNGKITQYTFFNEIDLGGHKSSRFCNKVKVKNGESVTTELSPNSDFKEFLKEKTGISKNKDFEAKYKTWKCIVSNKNTIDLAKKEFCLDVNDYDSFLKTNFNTIKRKFDSGLISIKNSKTKPRLKTILEDVLPLFKTPEFKKAVYRDGVAHEIVEAIMSEADNLNVISKNNIFTSVTKSKLDLVIEIGELVVSNNYNNIKKAAKLMNYTLPKKNKQEEGVTEQWINMAADFLFSGSEILGQEKYQIDLFGKPIKKKPDLLLINKYGEPIVVELKKPSANILKYDGSHSMKLTPTAPVVDAVSQAYNYSFALSMLDDKGVKDIGIKKEYIPMTKAYVFVGSFASMVEATSRRTAVKENGEDLIKKMVDHEIKLLNSKLHQVQVVIYDELLERLKSYRKSIYKV